MKHGCTGRRLNAAGGKLVAALAVACIATTAHADSKKSGEHVYKETCHACHANGVDDAPRFGDKAKWGPLIAEGQAIVTAHGWWGVRKMPPRGARKTSSWKSSRVPRPTWRRRRVATGRTPTTSHETHQARRKRSASRN